MRYRLADKKERIIAFLIDAIIVTGIGSLLASIVFFYSGLYEYYLTTKVLLNEALAEKRECTQEAVTLIGAMAIRTGVYSGFNLVTVVIYLIIFPLVFEWQTVGRLVTKTRVLVCRTNVRPDLKHLILRDGVGIFLFYIVLSTILMWYNFVMVLSMIFAMMSGVSIPDRISHTKFVNKEMEPEIDEDLSFEYPTDENVIDAEEVSVTEVEEPEVKE